MIRILVCVLISLIINEAAKVTLTLIPFQNATETKMVCNDGSPSGFFYKKGDPNKFSIHLQGGAWCWDQTSCDTRWKQFPFLMSSKNWSTSMEVDGMFNDDPNLNPLLYDATHVYVAYCTSDNLSGTAPASSSTFGWNFFGKHVITGLMKLLVNQFGLDTAKNVLISGCSAGGSSTIANIDYMASLIPAMSGRVVKGHVDAGFFLETTPMIDVPSPYVNIFSKGAALWNGIPDQDCMKAYPNDYWMCYLGQYAWQHIQTPTQFNEQSTDNVQLWRNGVSYPMTPQMEEYTNEFRMNMTVQLSMVSAPHAVISPACYFHCTSEGPQYHQVRITNGNISESIALESFFLDNQAADNIDDCDGFNCSYECPTPQ